MAKPGPPIVWWMDAAQYAKLPESDKLLVSAAINTYETTEAGARKDMTDAIAGIVDKHDLS